MGKRNPPAPLDLSRDDQVLTLAEWRSLNRLSERTARRILHSPDAAPVTVMLSRQRVGVTVRANRDWQAARVRA